MTLTLDSEVYHTELQAWMNHAGLDAKLFCDLTGAALKSVIDWRLGHQPIPQWALAVCRLSAALCLEARIDSVSDYLASDAGLEPFEMLGLTSDQRDNNFAGEAALEALRDRYGECSKLVQVAYEWATICRCL